MKSEMRDVLARQPFEEKIRKVAELIRLARKLKAQRVREDAQNFPKSGFRNPQSFVLPPKNSKK
jgi:hypothetical protein